MSLQTAPRRQLASSGSIPVLNDFAGLWTEAQKCYRDETGHELPSADDFPSKPRDPDEVIQYIDRQGRGFQTFRTKGEKIRRALKPIVSIVLPFLDAGAEGAAVCTTAIMVSNMN